MPVFYLVGHGHTLASALRATLEDLAERRGAYDTVVSCTKPHPLDDHLEVQAPDEAFVREALLDLREQLLRIRASLGHGCGPRPPPVENPPHAGRSAE